MAQIIKQPDGRYAAWSKTVSDFTALDATPEEIIDLEVEDFRDKVTKRVHEVVGMLERGEKPYYQFTKTWDEACAFAREVHGAKWTPGNGNA